LSGAVSISQPPLTAAQKLDVYRVEQRLAYLGYSAFGMNSGTDANHVGIPKEIKVNGIFSAAEESALRAFYVDTHYSTFQRSGITNSGSGNYGMQTTLTSNAAKTVPAGTVNPTPTPSNNDTNLSWLNAYNAPHWMNIYKEFNIPYSGSTVNFIDGQDRKEIYATSWVSDLITAWTISKNTQGLTTYKLRINGLSDPTETLPAYTHAKGGHSAGMSIDLGVKGQFIDPGIQMSPANGGFTSPRITGNGVWSIQNALNLSAPPNLPDVQGNNQSEALRNFLSIYALTQKDGNITNGTWTGLPIQNGNAVRVALFGSGINRSLTGVKKRP
jgi:hypothetical protein